MFKLNKNFILFSLIFILAFSVYLFTLAPTVTMEDSGELIAAAYNLGIAHPPGFPLYAMLGKIFTFIPLSSIAWRVNLMSAFFGALTVTLFAFIILKLFKDKVISFCFSLLLAFSPIFWSQSIIAEVYTLNTFFVCILILFLLFWEKDKNNKYLYWFSFTYGLSLTNHTMLVLLAPAFTLYILFINKKIVFNWKIILKMFLLFLFGLSFYLYIPIRAFGQADFNWGPITTWQDVFAHIRRSQYGDLGIFENTYSKLGIAVSFFIEIYKQFFWPAIILALGGLIYLFKKYKSFAILSSGIFLFNSLAIIFLRKFGWHIGIEYTYRVYYLPAFMMFIIWLAAIVFYLYSFLKKALVKKEKLFIWVRFIFIIVLISLPTSFLIGNYKNNDLSNFWFNYDYAKNLLNSLEPNSIYYFSYDGSLQGDTELFSLVYFQLVENFRPDVDIVSEHNFFYKKNYVNLPEEYYDLNFLEKRDKFLGILNKVKDRPIYTNFSLGGDDNAFGFFTLSNVYVHKLYSNLNSAKEADFNGYLSAIRNLDEIEVIQEYSKAGLASHYYYNLAYYYLILGEQEKSQHYLIKAFNLDTAPFNHEYSRFINYRATWLGKK